VSLIRQSKQISKRFSRRSKLDFVYGTKAPQWAMASSLSRLYRHTTLVWTPLDQWSARRRELYLTPQNKTDRHAHSPARFEPTIPASELSHTQVLGRAVTGVGQTWN
jgi:hypothetical protein